MVTNAAKSTDFNIKFSNFWDNELKSQFRVGTIQLSPPHPTINPYSEPLALLLGVGQWENKGDGENIGAVAAFCDSGAVYKCHDLLTYLLIGIRRRSAEEQRWEDGPNTSSRRTQSEQSNILLSNVPYATGTAPVNWTERPVSVRNSRVSLEARGGDDLTLSTPAVLNCCCSKGSAQYWSNPPFLIFDIRALWRSVLSARAPECKN